MLDLVYQRQYRRRTRRSARMHFSRIKLVSYLVTGGFIAFIAAILLFGVLFFWYARDLPQPGKVVRSDGFSTIIFDRDGEVLYDIFQDQNRVPIEFDEIPESLKQATIAIEDKTFYDHEGFSVLGMLRGFSRIIFKGRLEGGSTLTQQLVKNVLLTQERTLPRKLKEFILAVQIERKFTKDEILQMYLNEAPYGSTAYGVETAAEHYFDKNARDLTVLESAILAGLPQSPTRYSPFGQNPESYIWRTEQVLSRMQKENFISRQEEKDFKEQLPNVKFAEPVSSLIAPHFVEYVREQLLQQFGPDVVEGGGLRVTTTLNSDLQKKAQSIVATEIDRLESLRVSNGAAVILDPNTGEILGMVGSRDFEATGSGGYKFNVATQGLRQPGSALKPITYATAFKKGYTPASLIMDVATDFPGGAGKEAYAPLNYDDKFRGPVHMRTALASSINVPAVKTLALVGVENMLQTAYDMGLSTLEPTKKTLTRLGLSATLGGGEVTLLELTSSFGVFATGGMRHEPVSILKVVDHDGKTLFEHKQVRGKRVLNEDIAYLVTHILSDNKAREDVFGLNSHLFIAGNTVAVKTGTTDDKRDNWTVGSSRSVSVGVWVGNNDNSPMHPSLASGLTGAAPIWNQIMRQSLAGRNNGPFDVPGNIVQMDIDAYGGGLPKSGMPTRSEVFIKGTEPASESPIYQKLKIARNEAKLANAIQKASGDYEEKEFIVFSEDDPISTDGINRWQIGIDEWLAKDPDPKFHPPTEVSSGKSDEVVVNITAPPDKKRIDDYDVPISVEAFSNAGIKKLTLYIDDDEFKTFDKSSFTEVVNLVEGVYEIRVKGEDDRGKSAEGRITIGVFEDVE